MFINMIHNISAKKNFLRSLAKKYSLPAIFMVLLICFTAGCEESTAPKLKTGKIVGWVQPIDQWNRALPESGVTVQLKGTSYSDVTNDEGHFFLEGVETGTYTITYNKEGFATNKIPFFDFAGGGKMLVMSSFRVPATNKYVTFLGQPPTFTARIDSIHHPTFFGKVRLEIALSTTVPQSGTAMFVFFKGTTPEVSADPSNYFQWITFGVPGGDSSFIADVYGVSGETIYYKIYPTSGFTTFLDPEAKSPKLAWSALGEPTDVIPISLPENSLAAASTKSFKGKFIFLGKSGNIIKEIVVPTDATQKETKQIFQNTHEYIMKYRKMWD